MDDDTLLDFAIGRPGAPDGVGDLHIGRIAARVPAMAGAFVTLEGAEGFLPDSAGAEGLQAGAPVALTVTRAAQGGKGPRLSGASNAPPAEGPPRLLQRGPGALERAAALHPKAAVLIDDPAAFAAMRPTLGDRARLVARAFDDALEAEIEALGQTDCNLPGGMRASIVPTPALTAIDLDTAAATAVRAAKGNAQLAANREAIPELARQIRLRNLGGAILVDFAGMPVRKRNVLAPALEEALRTDPAHPRLVGFTGLGLAEILRPRIHPPLHEMLAGPHASGLAALRLAAATPSQRLALRASPAIVSALQSDAVAMADLARRMTHPLILASDPSLGPQAWIIEDAPRA